MSVPDSSATEPSRCGDPPGLGRGSAASAGEPPLVALHRATKSYGGRCVLRIGQLEVQRGDSLLIVGANGSGKSTLLRMLAGITCPSSGRVAHAPGFDALDIAYVPQAGGAHPNWSVAENLRQALRLRGRSVPDRLQRHWYVGGLGLDAHLDKLFRDLSGGFQRLTALACALVVEPGALFIDEAASGVDEQHARTLADGLSAAMSHLDLLVLSGHSAADFPAARRCIELRGGEPV
jgi:ABC-2 type transport system ATP-binding protein